MPPRWTVSLRRAYAKECPCQPAPVMARPCFPPACRGRGLAWAVSAIPRTRFASSWDRPSMTICFSAPVRSTVYIAGNCRSNRTSTTLPHTETTAPEFAKRALRGVSLFGFINYAFSSLFRYGFGSFVCFSSTVAEAPGKRFSPSFSGCACRACSLMTVASLYKPASAFVDTTSSSSCRA